MDILKRTTFIVADAEQSARFYADVCGLREWYRNELTVDGRFPPLAADGARAKLIVMQGEDAEIGMLGFLQYLDSKGPDLPPPQASMAPGQPVLVFRSADVGALAERARAAGALSISGPARWEVPAVDGSVATLETVGLFDPSGIYCEASARR